MPDFGLLSSAAQVPLRASFEPVSESGSLERAYTLAGERVKTEESIRQARTAEADRSALAAAMQSGADFTTPQGVDQMLKSLQGKLSPDAFLRLEGEAQKRKASYAQTLERMAGLDTERLNLFAAQTETAMPMIGNFLDVANKFRAAKGDAGFEDFWNQGRQALLADLGQRQVAPGVPMFPPQVLEQFKSATPEELQKIFSSSKTSTRLIEDAKRLAEARKTEAVAKNIETTGSMGKGSPTDLERYERMLKSGDISEEEFQKLKAGFLEKHGPKAAGAVDLVAQPPSQAETLEARKYVMTGKMPQVGTGGVAAQKRLRILEIAAKEAENMGMGAEQVVQLQNKIRAAAEGTKRLMTQSAQIRAGEENVQGVLSVLEDEVKKLGGPDSPKLKGLMNKAYTEWAGNPEFVGINQAYLDLTENMARIYSGVTGAGGTPVSFLELAKKSLPDNPSLAQVLKLKETVPRLFKVRREATEKELDEISKTAKLPTASASSAQPALGNPEQVKVIRAEYDKAVKERRLDDARATRAELKRLGVDVPEPGVTTESASGWKEIAPGVRVRVKP